MVNIMSVLNEKRFKNPQRRIADSTLRFSGIINVGK